MLARRLAVVLTVLTLVAAVVAGARWWRRPPEPDLADVTTQLRLVEPVAPLVWDAQWTENMAWGARWSEDLEGVTVRIAGEHRADVGIVTAAWAGPEVGTSGDDEAAACQALAETARRLHTNLKAAEPMDAAALRASCLDAADHLGSPAFPTDLARGQSPTRRLAGDRVSVTGWAASVFGDEDARRMVFTVTVTQLDGPR